MRKTKTRNFVKVETPNSTTEFHGGNVSLRFGRRIDLLDAIAKAAQEMNEDDEYVLAWRSTK